MSTSNEIDPSSSSSSFSTSKVSDLSKLVGEELDNVEKLFEDAKLAMEKVFDQINEARGKLNNLLIMQDQHHQKKQQLQSKIGGGGGGGGGGDEHQTSQTENHLCLSLQELNDKVSHLKSLIPSILVIKKQKPPSECSYSKLPASPHPPRRRRCLEPPPSPPHLDPKFDKFFDFDGLEPSQKSALHFIVAFQNNTVINKSLLHRFMETVLTTWTPQFFMSRCEFAHLVEEVYKKGTDILAGYWLNPLSRSIIEERLAALGLHNEVHITGNIDNEEFIYSDDLLKSTTYTCPSPVSAFRVQ